MRKLERIVLATDIRPGRRCGLEQLLQKQDFGDIAWQREIRSGPPAELIVAVAQDYMADLIVMGASGRTGMARFLIGSTTRRAIQQLPCSLPTVKRPASYLVMVRLTGDVTVARRAGAGDSLPIPRLRVGLVWALTVKRPA